MDWAEHAELSKMWITASRVYVAAVDKFVRKARTYGAAKAGREPEDPREPLGPAVIEVVREANEAGEIEALRRHFPPAHRPFIGLMEAAAQTVRNVVAIDEARVLAAVGDVWQHQGVFLFDEAGAQPVPDALAVARTPDRSHFAIAYAGRVDLHRGWGGPIVASWPIPRGNEGIPPTISAPAAEELHLLDLQLLPDASGAIVLMPEGVFRTGSEGVVRLFPSRAGTLEALEDAQEEGEEELAFHFDMLHAAVHPSGALVAVGAQSSQHELVDLDGERVAEFGPLHSEYPHHASFDPNGETAAFNSCHFYNGVTLVAEVESLRDLALDPYEEHEALRVLDPMCRVYCSAWVGDPAAFVMGDAYGYLRARAVDGSEAWKHHLGSTLRGMDLSPSRKRLFVGSASGFLHVLELDAGEPDPFIIGESPHHELRRYVCWADEPIWRW